MVETQYQTPQHHVLVLVNFPTITFFAYVWKHIIKQEKKGIKDEEDDSFTQEK